MQKAATEYKEKEAKFDLVANNTDRDVLYGLIEKQRGYGSLTKDSFKNVKNYILDQMNKTTGLSKQAGSEAEQPSNNQTKEYRYAMVNRPAGLSTVPKGFIRLEERPSAGSPHYAAARNGVVVYDRKLTDDETKKYEMSPMVDGDDLHEYADNIANEMKEYASQYVELANNDIAGFIDEVKNRISESSAGFRPSIGDINHLAELVKNKLSDAIVVEPQPVEPDKTETPTDMEETAKIATPEEITEFINDIAQKKQPKAKRLVVNVASHDKNIKVKNLTNVDVGVARELLIPSTAVHVKNRHPDMDISDWLYLQQFPI